MPGRKMQLGANRRRNKKAPAKLFYAWEANQPVIYAMCLYTQTKVGPITGHMDVSKRRALATLTERCECPARWHAAREFEGQSAHSK